MQFYRQKPIGNFIVDFFAPKPESVIEVDGSQHLQARNIRRDEQRDAYLSRLGLSVLRLDSREVLKRTDAVMKVVYHTVSERLGK